MDLPHYLAAMERFQSVAGALSRNAPHPYDSTSASLSADARCNRRKPGGMGPSVRLTRPEHLDRRVAAPPTANTGDGAATGTSSTTATVSSRVRHGISGIQRITSD
jgi:hypothetical protein